MQGINSDAARRFLRFTMKNNPHKLIYRQGALDLLIEATTHDDLNIDVGREVIDKLAASLMATEEWNHDTSYAFSRQLLSLSALVNEFHRPSSREVSGHTTPSASSPGPKGGSRIE